MISVLAISPDPTDATSFYRCVGPLSAFRISGPDIRVNLPTSADWTSFKFADVLLLQRPVKDEHIRVAELAKEMNVPIWIDYDDNLLAITADNPSQSIYDNAKAKQNMQYLLAIADHVTVSTERMREEFYPINQNITTIQNAWDDYTYPIKDLKWQTPAKRVFWRGGHSHQLDLFEAKNDIVELHKRYPDVEFVFMGYRPWFIESEFIDKTKFVYIPFQNLSTYFHKLRGIRPAATIFPLKDTVFNRCKSNIAWLESTYMGAPTFYRDLPEWPNRGVSHWLDNIETILSSSDADIAKPLWEKQLSIVEDNFLLSNLNKIRAKVICDLAGRDS